MSTIDPSPVIACASIWRPRPGWAATLREPHQRLTGGATGVEAVTAWCDVAMMMGDTHAAPLALVVCLHAEHEVPPGYDDRRLAAHRDLCLLDLGLTQPTSPGPIKLVALGAPGTVDDRPGELAAWLYRALAPFDHDLARAARFALAIAAVRVGLVEGPEPVP